MKKGQPELRNDDPSITLDDSVNELADLTVLVVGDNQCWGKSPLLEDALVKAYKPKRYIAYIAHKDTTVHEVSGSLMYPKGYPPLVIARKGLTGIKRK